MAGDTNRKQATLQSQGKLNDYIDFAKSITGKSNHQRVVVLNELEEKLKAYNALVAQYSTPLPGEGEVEYPELDRNTVQNLKEKLQATCEVTSRYLQSNPKKDSFYNSVLKIHNILFNEGKVYRNFVQGKTLGELIERSKGQTISVAMPMDQVNRVGNSFNTRMVLNIKEGKDKNRKGVFTEQVKLDYELRFDYIHSEWRRSFQTMSLIGKSPNPAVPKMIGFLDMIEESRKKREPQMSLADYYVLNFPYDPIRDDIRVATDAPKEITKYCKDVMGFSLSDNGEITSGNDPASILCYSWFTGDVKSAVDKNKSQYDMYKGLHHLKKGDRIDSRNSAMYSVAALLGQEKIIARAEPMTLVRSDGRIVKGTFMDYVDGVDMSKLSKTDPCLEKEVFISGGIGLKSVADLNVLDYICGNTDRHWRNMIYQTDADGNFTGVIGIDNDLSFGTVESGSYRYGSEPKDFGIMSREMVEKLQTITPEMLRLALGGYGLKKEDIDSAVDRLNQLKKTLELDMAKESPEIQIVEEGGWDDIKLDAVAGKIKTAMNIYSTLQKTNTQLQKRKEIWAKQGKIGKEPEKMHFSEATVNEYAVGKSYADIATKMNGLLDALKEANKGMFIGSREYDNMMHYAEYMDKELGKMAFLEKPEGMSQEMFDDQNYSRAQTMFNIMRDLTGMYLEHRKEDGKLLTSETAGKRTLVATEVFYFVKKNCERFNVSTDDIYRAELAKERKAAYKKLSTKEIRDQINRLKSADSAAQNKEAAKLQSYLKGEKANNKLMI